MNEYNNNIRQIKMLDFIPPGTHELMFLIMQFKLNMNWTNIDFKAGKTET